jgi:4-amino-4-deoxy-L-arabinose transferase-like glycosyltransferase
MLLPFLLQPNLRPDSVEKFFVGKEWLVSTAKHPTLTSAIIETAYFLTGHTPECTYLVTGIALFVMLWSIWKVSNLFLPPPLALLATFASCNYRYLNIGSTFFHESIAVLPFWTLTVLLFYHALKSEKYRYWIAAGVTCGGGLLCKYPMILLAAACFLFVLIFKETRKQSGKLCLTAFIAILIVLPHFCWNYQHGFPTLDYLANKGKMANPHIADHVVSPLLFLGSQLILLLPVWLSICPVFRRAKSINQASKTEPWKHFFLGFIVLVPILLQTAQCVFSGHRMRAGLGTHLWLFITPCLLYYLPVREPLAWKTSHLRCAFFRTGFIAVITACCFMIHLCAEPFLSEKTGPTLFPGRELAAKTEAVWHEKFTEPIPYAAGDWILAGNAALYGKDRPTVLPLDPKQYPGVHWAEPEDIRRCGGVILWQIPEMTDDVNPMLPDYLRDYPSAEILAPFELKPQTRAAKPPVKIGMALIPPKHG